MEKYDRAITALTLHFIALTTALESSNSEAHEEYKRLTKQLDSRFSDLRKADNFI